MTLPVVLPIAVLMTLYLPPALVLSVVDAREHRLPNRWVGLLTATVCAGLLLCALLVPELRGTLWAAAVLALVLGLAAIALALLSPALLGMGDAKTVPVVVLMSAALGGEVLLAGLLGIALFAGLCGAAVMLRAGRSGVRFAVGPVLLAGPFLGLLGAPLLRGALGLS